MSDEKDPLEQDEQLSPQEKKDKETKKYLNSLDIVSKVVGGKENLRPRKKVTPTETAQIVADLFKEEEQELLKAAKEGLKEILKKHLELEAEVSKKQKELDELVARKRKEFTQSANNWLQKIDQAEIQKESYGAALKMAFSTPKEK